MSDLARLVGGVGAALVGPWIVFLFGFSLAFPFMLISVVLNIARSRRALERIAEATEATRGSGSGSVLGI